MVSRKAGGSVNEILNLDCNLPVCDTMHSGRWISAFGRVRVRIDVAIFYVSLVYVTMLLVFLTLPHVAGGFCGLIRDTSCICLEGLSP